MVTKADDLKSTFEREGFIVLRNALPEDVPVAIFNDVRRCFWRQLVRFNFIDHGKKFQDLSLPEFETALYKFFSLNKLDFKNTGKQAQHMLSLHRLATDPLIINKLHALGLGDPNICTRPTVQFNSPRLAENEANWMLPSHQDWAQTKGSLNSLVVWLPLVKVDINLGALEVVPGSHCSGLLPTSGVDYFVNKIEPRSLQDKKFISLSADVGDLIVFSTFLVHRSGRNVTSDVRWSVQLRYNDLEEQDFINRGYPHNFVYHPLPT